VKFFIIMIAMALPSYLLGSVNGAIIASKYFFRKDIREYGSGNPGLTNFYRIFGQVGAALVVAIDVLKTMGPVIFGGWLFHRYLGMPASAGWLFKHFFDVSLFGQALAGFFVMLGHCYPAFYGFKGGKGVMAAGVILFFLDWRLALVSWGTFILVTALTRFVSLGAILGGAMLPISQLIFGIGGVPSLIATTMCALLLISRHHQNIKRLITGAEPKFSFRRAGRVGQ